MDYDNDRDEDILLIDSTAWPDRGVAADTGSVRPVLTLLANDGTGKFRDVTARSGLDVNFRAMGVAVSDYDNDGLRDIFVTGIGESRLWHNEGGGRFRDVTSAAGISCPSERWATSAAWLDYDNDGLLDLFVCDYGEWQDDKQTASGGLTVYRNAGNGKFQDASVAAGLSSTRAKSFARCLALAAIDLNDDGWMDIVLSNDGGPNFAFRNRADGTFAECAACGLAYDSTGNEQRSRGIDTAWCRDDPCLLVAVAAASGEGLKVYSGRSHALQFVDEAPGHGIAAATRKHSTYGVVFLDYDLDGWPDILTANGGKTSESPQLFWNEGQPVDMAFHSVTPKNSGQALFTPLAGRGVAYADIDGDNDLDLLITQNGASPVLLRNDQQTGHRSLRVRLIGSRSARDGIGARLTLHSGDHFWRAQVMGTRGYLSQSEVPITFGFGSDRSHRDLEVRWPSGYVQKLRVKPTERSITVIEPLKSGFADTEP